MQTLIFNSILCTDYTHNLIIYCFFFTSVNVNLLNFFNASNPFVFFSFSQTLISFAASSDFAIGQRISHISIIDAAPLQSVRFANVDLFQYIERFKLNSLISFFFGFFNPSFVASSDFGVPASHILVIDTTVLYIRVAHGCAPRSNKVHSAVLASP